MARPRNDKGVGGWIRQWWRALLAEVISTAILVWLGCATLATETIVLTHPALAFGFVVLGNICAFGPASGAHMNPAVTLGAVLYGQLPVVPGIGYVLAQIVGAIIGFAGLMATTPAKLLQNAVAVTHPGEGVSALGAVAIEAVITGTLVIAVCGVWSAHDPAHPDSTVPIKLGLVVAGVVYAGGPFTGASLNPARSFAPALLQGRWDDQWIYWVGPLLGSAIAALLHRYVLTPSPAHNTPEAQEVELPLNDKA